MPVMLVFAARFVFGHVIALSTSPSAPAPSAAHRLSFFVARLVVRLFCGHCYSMRVLLPFASVAAYFMRSPFQYFLIDTLGRCRCLCCLRYTYICFCCTSSHIYDMWHATQTNVEISILKIPQTYLSLLWFCVCTLYPGLIDMFRCVLQCWKFFTDSSCEMWLWCFKRFAIISIWQCWFLLAALKYFCLSYFFIFRFHKIFI